jgi:hypothetical protein
MLSTNSVATRKEEALQLQNRAVPFSMLMFLAISTATPQDSFDLRARYRDPDVERFAIRAGREDDLRVRCR